jgi:type 1 glutamine amidotransferase
MKTIHLFLALLLTLTASNTSFAIDQKTALAVLSSDANLQQKAEACQQLSRIGEADAVPVLAALLHDPQLSSYARTGLELIPASEAGQALRAALSTLKGRQLAGVVNSLGKRGDESAVPALQRLVTQDQTVVAPVALAALAQIGSDAALSTILTTLESGPEVLRLPAAQAALDSTDMLIKNGNKSAVNELLKAVLAAPLPDHIKATAKALALSIQAESGFISMFDGATLEGWDGNPVFWRVDGGEIVGETTAENPTKGNTFLIWDDDDDVADFELKVEFKLRNHNSGIQYRSFPIEGHRWVIGGYQADMSEGNQWTGAVYGEKYKQMMAIPGEKSVVGATPKQKQHVASLISREALHAHLKSDEWNEYHIIARGNHCIQMINGVITAEFSESTDDRLKSGLIALQLHAGPPMEVRFRNLRLRELNPADKKEILFLAGTKSHGYGAHEHKAGAMLLARSLNESGLDVIAQVVTEGAWPEPWMGYQKPDSIVMYCDGYKGHMAKAHQDKIQVLSDAGVGVACLHFGVEVEPSELGPQFLDWIGGYFEIGWSVNPHWTPKFTEFPDHPISRGVQPFAIQDEWYYHMRFQPQMAGVTPILSALPPLRTLTDRANDSNRGSNPVVMAEVSAGRGQHLAWAYERPNGGRGFGFTGGHFHQNWQQDDFRKLVLNALVWTAQGEVPTEGVPSRAPSAADLELNQDFPKPNVENRTSPH